MTASLRDLPAVHRVVELPLAEPCIERFGRGAVTRACRAVIDEIREQWTPGNQIASIEDILTKALLSLEASTRLPFRGVINATGVILHTNLGRSPLSTAAQQAVKEVFAYCDLEFDLGEGKRARRQRDVNVVLKGLTGAEAGLAVNNNAAAMLLALAALHDNQPVAISRGHLVEIGGSFRVPDILRAAGATLDEIGTTNKTHLSDFEAALERGAKTVVWVHRSNFEIRGFASLPSLAEVVELGHRFGARVIFDQGSGELTCVAQDGDASDPTVLEAVRTGVDVTCFSGDKLLGGPQAGLVVGTQRTIETLANHPIARAVRCDKLQLAALLATLGQQVSDQRRQEIPIEAMQALTVDDLTTRAQRWQQTINRGEVRQTEDKLGGGSKPGATIEGIALVVDVPDVHHVSRRLRQSHPAVVARISQERLWLHPRTVMAEQETDLLAALKEALCTT